MLACYECKLHMHPYQTLPATLLQIDAARGTNQTTQKAQTVTSHINSVCVSLLWRKKAIPSAQLK